MVSISLVDVNREVLIGLEISLLIIFKAPNFTTDEEESKNIIKVVKAGAKSLFERLGSSIKALHASKTTISLLWCTCLRRYSKKI